MRRKLVLFSFCVLVSIFFSACGRPAKRGNTVVIWHWMNDRDEAFQALAQKYEEKTGIKVSFELYDPAVYAQKITAAGQTRNLPDVFGILNPKAVLASFIQNGFVVNLKRKYEQDNSTWEKSLNAKAVAATRFEEENIYGIAPGIYGVPIDMTSHKVLYNKKLLEKAGVEKAPETFQEFLGSVRALNRVGIPALVSGWGEIWMVDCFASSYALNIMGEEKVLSTYRGDVPYTDPDWVAVLEVFEMLRENNALMGGIVTKTNKDAELDFALGRAAFAFNGSWCVNVYHDMNPDLEYGSILPPPVSDKYPMLVWGGAGSSFLVNKNSPHKHEAMAFLRWLTSRKQQIFLAQETMNLPSNHFATAEIPETLAAFASSMKYATHPSVWPVNEDPLVTEKFVRGIQSIIIGEKTPQQVAQEVQAVKERVMEKKKKRQT